MTAYTSSLSVDEFLLVRQVGYRPVGLVVGSSVFRVARRGRLRRRRQDQELTAWSQPPLEARRLAVERLRHRAALTGAAGVIGIAVDVVHTQLRYEVVATGTALAGPADGAPFTCALSGQQFWALLQGGRLPVGLVMGASAYYRPFLPPGPVTWSPPLNDESPWRTEGIYRARALAMDQMTGAARQLGAAATVGVTVCEVSRERAGDYGSLHEFTVTGTAVRDSPGRGALAPPLPMLPLR